MKILSEKKTIEKKSRFEANLVLIEKEEDIDETIKQFSKKHKKANHICYGIYFNKETIFKNDGEVGHPGNILLNILKSKNLDSHLLIVARYFGGIKLGPSGVGKAFRNTGILRVENNQ